MAGSFNTEAFVSAVRLRGYIPATDDAVTFPQDADIINLANQEMVAFLVPWILSARAGHFLTNSTIATVAQQAGYTFPSRAVGSTLSFAQLVDSSGNPLFPGLVEADPEIATQWPGAGAVFGQPQKFYVQGNQIMLVPAPSDNSMSLKLEYPQRPNQIVATTSVGVITAITQVSTNYQIAYSGTPAGFTASATYEVVHAAPGFEIVSVGAANGSGAGYIQFAGTAPTTFAVGDSLCLIDTANYPTNVPADLWLGVFADWLALRISEIRGDAKQMERCAAVFKRTEKMARDAYLGKRDTLGHRKVSSYPNRGWGRRPLYWVK